MNKTQAKQVADRVSELLSNDPQLKALGVRLQQTGSWRYDAQSLVSKIEFRDTSAPTANEAGFKRYEQLLGVPLKDQVVTIGRNSYKLVDVRDSARSKPFVGEDLKNGKRYILSVEDVESGLNKKPAPTKKKQAPIDTWGPTPGQCANDKRFKPGVIGTHQCPDQAVTTRKTFRWGDKAKGEPAVVDLKYHLCRRCADSWDESKAEARAEARGS